MSLRRRFRCGAAIAVITLACTQAAFGQPESVPLGPQLFEAAWRHSIFVQPVLISRYNRVDGIVHSLNLRGRVPCQFNRPPLMEASGRVDVHASALPHYHVRGGSAGITANLPRARLGATHGYWASVTAQYRKETASPDDWIVGSAENSVAALFAKNDYKNYYLREGYALVASLSYVPQAQRTAIAMNLEWHDDLQRPLESTTEWSLMPVDRLFRPNITATPGRERLLRLAAAARIQDAARVPFRTFQLGVTIEKAGGTLGGDFEYEGAFIEAKSGCKTIGNQWLNVRIVAGGRTGDLASQHLLRLGGIGTLRGVPHQRLTGNRMWMLNAEYRLGGDVLGRPTFCPFSNGWVRRAVALMDVGVLYDVGTAYGVSEEDGTLAGWFEGRAIDNWGIFLSIAHDLFRLEWAMTKFLGREHAGILRLRVGLEL